LSGLLVLGPVSLFPRSLVFLVLVSLLPWCLVPGSWFLVPVFRVPVGVDMLVPRCLWSLCPRFSFLFSWFPGALFRSGPGSGSCSCSVPVPCSWSWSCPVPGPVLVCPVFSPLVRSWYCRGLVLSWYCFALVCFLLFFCFFFVFVCLVCFFIFCFALFVCSWYADFSLPLLYLFCSTVKITILPCFIQNALPASRQRKPGNAVADDDPEPDPEENKADGDTDTVTEVLDSTS